MRFVELFSETVWGLALTREKVDEYTKFIRHIKDTEYIYNYIYDHKQFLTNNPEFNGFTFQEIIISAQRECRSFERYLKYLFCNGKKDKKPNFEDKFVLLDRYPRTEESKMRRKMYGKRKEFDQPPSVIRLYALRLHSKIPDGIPGYIVIGGGIKLCESTRNMGELEYFIKLYEGVQSFLKQHNINNKEELIAHISNTHEKNS